MKEIKITKNTLVLSQIFMELNILHESTSEYIVDFYGAFYLQGSVYCCIEYMEGGSIEGLYKKNDMNDLNVIEDRINGMNGMTLENGMEKIDINDVEKTCGCNEDCNCGGEYDGIGLPERMLCRIAFSVTSLQFN